MTFLVTKYISLAKKYHCTYGSIRQRFTRLNVKQKGIQTVLTLHVHNSFNNYVSQFPLPVSQGMSDFQHLEKFTNGRYIIGTLNIIGTLI